MKLSVNETKLTGLWARNCAIEQVQILKFAFGPEKFSGLSRNGAQIRSRKQVSSFQVSSEIDSIVT